MMNSASSTEPVREARAAGIQPWQFYLLLSLIGATAAVVLTRHTQPVALVLLSAAILAAGLVAGALHGALAGFLGLRGAGRARGPLATRTRDQLEREKMFALRSIKELEFDRAMGKVSDADYAEMNRNLRARALALMQELERDVITPPAAAVAEAPDSTSTCPKCGTHNDDDARFCKRCGAEVR